MAGPAVVGSADWSGPNRPTDAPGRGRGKTKGRGVITTHKSKREDTRPDLVQRRFFAEGPNRLLVADITCVKTESRFAYAAFVIDVFSRKIASWTVAETVSTHALPLQALHKAIQAARGGLDDLIHHSDHGSIHLR